MSEGEKPMKFLRCYAILVLLCLCSCVVMADGIGDPKFTPIGGTGSTILTSPTDPLFKITYTAGTTPTVACSAFGGTSENVCILDDFINNSEVAWKAIQFAITSATAGLSFTADNSLDPYFTSAAVSTNTLGETVLSFSGTDATHPGILAATSCTSGEGGVVCTGPFIDDTGIKAFDFGILVDVNDALKTGDSFTAQGTATPTPEPSTLVLLLAGGVSLFFFYLKKS